MMPWQTNEAGEKKYELSIYCKEELPTWDELYNEFYIKESFQYDPSNPEYQVMDPYWNRPRRKLLMAWACNQLNKIILEGRIDYAEILNGLSSQFTNFHFIIIEDSSLLLNNGSQLPWDISKLVKWDGAPKIYSCKLPSTNKPSIFQTKHPRIDIDDLNGPIRIIAVGCMDELWCATTTPKKLIGIALKDVINYFENGIGWKDEDGNMLPVDAASKMF